MSVYTNQTNANATSYFPGLGGSSNFPNGISIDGVPITNTAQGIVFGALDSINNVTANTLYFGNGNIAAGTKNNDRWTTQGLTIQGAATGTTYPNVIQLNSAVAGSGNDTISLDRVSTIATAVGSGGTNYTIDMVALASTMKSLYPGVVQ